MRVLICGGGVIGAAIAYFLGRRGADAIVIERTEVGCAASGKSGGFLALEKIDLTIADKEFVAIVGPSGCGKTTCMRMVAGFEFPTAGTVSVDGHKVTGPGPDRAVVFQQFALFPWKTVSENIALGLRNKGVEKTEREKRVRQAVAAESR